MIIAMLFGLIFMMLGGSSTAIHDRISESIKDPDTRKSALEVVKSTTASEDDFMNALAKNVAEISKVHSSYTATKADYERVLDDAAAARRQFHAKQLEDREKLRKILSPEEWKLVFDPSMDEGSK